jgi:hypothetical protein
MIGGFFLQRKRGFDDGRNGIKKKAGIDPAFQYAKKGSRLGERGSRKKKKESRPLRMGFQAVIATGRGKD